ncbi:MAG: peptidoglycan bridge formation glycyltransferase FemA/FemB family protein [Spirochaetia bacterium]|nr:peptidoglycan bridge formation glycyltransferase FemA/FemB family protein [Spirochaetia bacterium]
MDVNLESKSTYSLFETPLVHQSSFWSSVKQKQGYKSLAFDIKVKVSDLYCNLPSSGYIVDDVHIILQPINRDYSIGYVPYGPLISPNEELRGDFIEELSEQLKETLPKHCALIRYDLPWENPFTKEISIESQQVRMNWGTHNHNIRKSMSDTLPSTTLIIDLTRSEEEILSSMKQKTRYNINLAKRKGVEVRIGGIKDFALFYDLYRQTALRNNFTLHESSFFTPFFEVKEEGYSSTLLIASLNNEPLSAMFLTLGGKRATYLFGASSNNHRESMSTYALQFKAMQIAKESGCDSYDMFGIAPSLEKGHPMSGLNQFKLGFGGSIFHRMGCWDYPIEKEVASSFIDYEMTAKGYHL